METARLYNDPLARVLRLDAKTSGLGAWLGFTSGGTTLLAVTMGLAGFVGWLHARPALSMQVIPEIEIANDTPPSPPAPSPQAEDNSSTLTAPVHTVPKEASPSPPAQAAKVLTVAPKPDEPVDLTGDAFVQGKADSYPGGSATANGTDTTAARSPPGAPPSPRAAPLLAVLPVQTPDRSRVASLSGGSEWSCPFPPEANTDQIDDAFVTLQVDVSAYGGATTVRALSDPGYGFGREARRCALAKRYSAAFDSDGKPIAGRTKPFRVHFSR
jgi:protein TonB